MAAITTSQHDTQVVLACDEQAIEIWDVEISPTNPFHTILAAGACEAPSQWSLSLNNDNGLSLATIDDANGKQVASE